MENENIVNASMPKKKSPFGEIVRFVITGVICTAIDFGIEYGLGVLFSTNLSVLGSKEVNGNIVPGYGSYIAIALCVIIGFTVSLLVNFFLSRKWVFQNVDKSINYNTAKYFGKYTCFAIGGLLLGLGVQCLSLYVVNLIWHINLSIDPFQQVDWAKSYNDGGIAFWAYLASFCIKTFIVLFYNYLTRKLFIFKTPKTAVMVEEASNSINDEVITSHYDAETTSFSASNTVTETNTDADTNISNDEIKNDNDVVTNDSIRVNEQAIKIEHKKEEIKAIEHKGEKVEAESKTAESADTDNSPNVIYGKPQFNWGTPLNKKNARDIVYASLEVFDKRKTPVASKKKIKEMIVEIILEEEEKRKNEGTNKDVSC